MFGSLVLFKVAMLHGQGYLQSLDHSLEQCFARRSHRDRLFLHPSHCDLFLRRSPDFCFCWVVSLFSVIVPACRFTHARSIWTV